MQYHEYKGELFLYPEDIEPFEWEGFDFARYYEGEVKVFQPQLEKLGFRVERWYNGEADSFGPLTRCARLVDSEGKRITFCYG